MYVVDLEKIQRLRRSRKLTQEEMSIRLGYKTGLGYHYLERGKCRITADQLAQIAEILDVPVSDLYAIEPTTSVAPTQSLPQKTGTEAGN